MFTIKNALHIEGCPGMRSTHYSVTTKKMSKIYDLLGGMFCHMQLNASTQVKLLRLSININFTKHEG